MSRLYQVRPLNNIYRTCLECKGKADWEVHIGDQSFYWCNAEIPDRYMWNIVKSKQRMTK